MLTKKINEMNIGYDAKRLFFNFTGLGNYSRTLVHQMSTSYPDVEYHLYSPKVPPDSILQQYDAEHWHIHSNRTALAAYWRSYGIRKDIAEHNLDIYHGLSNEIPYGMTSQRPATVVTIHDLIYSKLPHTFPWFDRQVYHAKTSHACRHADHIIAISNSTKQDIVSAFGIEPSKISTIYQSCLPIYYAPATPAERTAVSNKYNLPSNYLLHVGTVEPRKNLVQILKALATIKPSHRPPLVVVGRGKSHLQKMKQTAAKMQLQHVYWLEGVSSNIELRALYAMADLFVYTSLYEGFGLPIVEAQLQGTAVVTSDVSSMPEAAGPHSYTVSPLNVEALANIIGELLSDDNRRGANAKLSEQYAHTTFSPSKSTRQVMACYKQLV